MLTYHLERLSFLLDTTMLPTDTRRQWATEELIVILRFLPQMDSLSRGTILTHLQTLAPSSTLQSALAKIACAEGSSCLL
ncbi:MAG: hypothetical protein H0T73_20600 [Ardenticatenales bacterium]|nr:hypothetical protein [Ardenticatenales bacterium]